MSGERVRLSLSTRAAKCGGWVLAGLLLCQAAAPDEELQGIVTRVFDGDSFVVKLIEGVEIEVRLGEIDAPEKDQPYADTARAALRDLILDRKLRLVVLDVDQYDRKVARVYRMADGVDVNAELVSRGHVWVYRRRVQDQSLYDLERRARDRRLGLWALPEAERTPPWRWRRAHPPSRRSSAPDQKVESPVASMSR